jgi:hypothetical protein
MRANSREVFVHSRIHALSLVFTVTLFLAGQQSLGGQVSQPRGHINPQNSDDDDARSRMSSEMAKKAAKERVAALKSDTDKLLKLSVELKEYVDKSDENVLSLDVIKKAEQIEKLAHSVKDKMKGPN